MLLVTFVSLPPLAQSLGLLVLQRRSQALFLLTLLPLVLSELLVLPLLLMSSSKRED